MSRRTKLRKAIWLANQEDVKRQDASRAAMQKSFNEVVKAAIEGTLPPPEPDMTLVEVYRMEAEIDYFGREKRLMGPWSAGIYDKKFEHACNLYRHNFSGCPKEPHEDGIDGWYSNGRLVCGCTDLYQLMEWFTRWSFNDLVAAGFKLNIYEVPACKVQVGHTQCVWYPDDAKLIGETTLDDLLDERRTERRIHREARAALLEEES